MKWDLKQQDLRQKCFGLLLSLFCILAFSLPAQAANHLVSDHIRATLEADGDVRVQETWNGKFTDPKTTENYIIKQRGTQIENFSVYMDGKPLQRADKWNVKGSFREKAGKYGIHYSKDGVELCWGITSYGSHTYTISYTMKGLAHKYKGKNTDYYGDGFNIRFFNDQMSTGPTEVQLTVKAETGPLTEENATVWSFGFTGEQKIENGVITLKSQKNLGKKDYMTLLAAFKKGTLPQAGFAGKTWEETQAKALEGSDYEEGAGSLLPGDWLNFAKGMAPGLLIVGLFAAFRVYRNRQKKQYLSSVRYVRDVPLPYTLGQSLYFSKGISAGNAVSNFALAGMLELIYTGSLESCREERGRREFALRLVHPPVQDDSLQRLFRVFTRADRNGDGFLDKKEMKKKEFGEQIYNLYDTLERETQDSLQGYGLQGNGLPWKQSGVIRQACDQHAGLMQFLRDMTLIQERSTMEVIIWHWYLVYAAVFGISEQVQKEYESLSRLSPAMAEEIDRQRAYYIYYRENIRSGVNAAVSDHSSSSSSSGGGGGSSGGGSGGGSR